MPGSRRQNGSQSLLVLPENQLAVSALKTLLSSETRKTPSQHLLTLTGPSGTGKSLLIRHALDNTPRSLRQKSVRLSAAEFAAQYADSVEHKSERQFQLRYRKNIDLFVLEDIQALGPRPETQQQLKATLDDILSHGGRCLLTSTRPAGEIPGLSKPLVNRIHGGITVSVDLPGNESRVLLCHHLASTYQLTLTETAARLMTKSAKTPADIVGILNSIRQRWQGSKKAIIDDDFIAKLTGHQPVPATPSIDRIAASVAREFQVSLQDLRGSSRSRAVLIPRQVAMYLARELTKEKFEDIGHYFGNRNHNTTLYACRKIKSLLTEDSSLARTVHRIKHDSFEHRPAPQKSKTR